MGFTVYQSLTLVEFLRIEAEISNCYIWIQQAINANLSAGRYYAIGGSGRGGGGGCVITHNFWVYFCLILKLLIITIDS